MARCACLTFLLLLCSATYVASYELKLSLIDGLKGQMANWTWPDVERLIKRSVDGFLVPNLGTLLKLPSKLNLSEECQDSLVAVVFSLRRSESWVIQMLDAMGKIPSGILDGTVMDFGSFDECLGLRFNLTQSTQLRGQYCMVGFSSPLLSPLTANASDGRSYVQKYGEPPKWIATSLERAGGFLKKVAFWFGACVPSSCSKDDVHKMATFVAAPLGFKVSVADCQTGEAKPFETYELASIYTLGALVALAFIGTVADVLKKCAFKKHRLLTKPTPYFPERIVLQILKSFSVVSNTERLLQSGGGTGTLSFFHGIRMFSATWIILGHTYFYVDTWKYLKYRHLIGVTDQFDRHLPAAVIENFTIPVSSFFFMSGCLITYTNWTKLESNSGRISWFFFVHKFWRMTPALALTLVLLFAMPLMDSGPIWYTTLEPEIGTCLENWWKNILYVSNWWDADNICLLHTWYLSALMQFHVVAVVLLLLTYRWPFWGFLSGLLLLAACTAATALRVMWQNFPMPAPGMIRDLDVIKEYNSDVYVKPYAHISSYLIGMVMGYVVLKLRHYKLRPAYHIAGWITAIVCGLTSVYGVYGPADRADVRAVYIALHRVGWAIALSWITFVCASGSSGFVGRLLSWKALRPFGQLSYLAYLLHPLVIVYRNASLKERVYYGHTELVFAFLSNTVVGFALAYVCYVAVELPFSTLEALIFSRSKQTSIKNGCHCNDSSKVTAVAIKPGSTEP